MYFQGLIDILKQPWFAVSPSPWSLAFYAIMALIGSQLLIKAGIKYKRAQRLMAFIDALLILGIIVCLQDTVWLLFNTARWILPLYSDVASFWNYYVRFAQNLLGILIGFLVSWPLWKARIVNFKIETLSWFFVIILFTGLVFIIAPGQQLTDWTWAVSHGYSDGVILESFLISHVGYKILIALAFLSVFNIEQSSIDLLKGESSIDRTGTGMLKDG